MQLTRFDRLLLLSIILALFVNLTASFVGNLSPKITAIAGVIVLIVMAIWLIVFAARYFYVNITHGKLAVEAFVLNEDKALLLYKHPFHGKFLPPGGRINSDEFPDIALGKRLKERIGIDRCDYEFNPKIHDDLNSSGIHIGQVVRLPVPFIIQKEVRVQRFFKRFHYDFIYVLDLHKKNVIFPDNAYAPFKFVDIEVLRDMSNKNEIFPDVLDAYERVLKVLG